MFIFFGCLKDMPVPWNDMENINSLLLLPTKAFIWEVEAEF